MSEPKKEVRRRLGRHFKIDSDPRRDKIIKALLSGMSISKVARTFKYNHKTISHYKNHVLAERFGRLTSRREDRDIDNLAALTLDGLDDLNRVMEVAIEKGQMNAALGAAGTARIQTIELTAKLAGKLGVPTTPPEVNQLNIANIYAFPKSPGVPDVHVLGPDETVNAHGQIVKIESAPVPVDKVIDEDEERCEFEIEPAGASGLKSK